MRRLLVLLAVLGVLGVCAPSYGYILVYKLSTTVKAVDTSVDAAEVIKLKGYLVVDYNETLDEVNDAEVVMYGKDQDDTLACFWLDDDEDLAIDYEIDNINAWVGFRQGGNRSGIEVLLTGAMKVKDIGLDDEDKSIPGTLKGTLIVWDEIFLDPTRWYLLKGSGNVSAPLHSGMTKEANEQGLSSNTIAAALIDELVAAGYVDVTDVSPP